MLTQVDSEAVRREQQEALDRVSAAVITAQEILAGGTLETGKRKAGLQAGDKPTKRARIYGFEDLSESDSDADSEYEAAARLAKAGQVAATVSSGDDSEASAQDIALAVASAGPDAPRHLLYLPQTHLKHPQTSLDHTCHSHPAWCQLITANKDHFHH